MRIRIIALALPFVVAAGGFAAAQRVPVAQLTTPETAQTNAPAPTQPAPAAPSNAPTVAPPAETIVIIPQIVTLPSPDGVTTPPPAPAPVAVAPPAPAPTPVVTAPPVPAPAPTVALPTGDAAPLPPQKPSMALAALPAKALFAAEKLPSLGKAMAIGYYPRGCLSGGVALPVNGPNWQVMRVSRNRNWGHPSLVNFLEKFAPLAAKATGWNGILVGDMAQPRGGPTPFGHMSHQTGLDVDIWFMPMPAHVLSREEREKTSATNLVADDWKHVNPKTWTPQHAEFIRTAAEQPGVERVLVNAAIKKEMCRMQGSKHPEWMEKIRPWYAHHDHIHVRMKCPADSPNCRSQPPVPDSDGCGKSLDYWFSARVLQPKKKTVSKKPPRAITLADLPPACKTVLTAPERSANN